MKKSWIALGIIILLAVIYLGFCSRSHFLLQLVQNGVSSDAKIKPGSYFRIQHRYAKPTPVAEPVIKLEIDRAQGQVVFYLQDGSTVQAALAGPEEAQWTKGCPTNISSTKMEILPLAEEKLVLGETTFENPYLVGNCPAPPTTIVLREGKEGLEGLADASACNWWQGAKCVYFGQEYINLHVQISSPETDEPLPEAGLILEAPWGSQAFSGSIRVRLPGNSLYPFTATAPGYSAYSGIIEVNGDTVIVRDAGASGEPAQAFSIVKIENTEDVNITIHLSK